MKWISMCACVFVLISTGCNSNVPRGRVSYSSPITRTPYGAPRRVTPAPAPRPVQPQTPPPPAITWSDREWTPPGGIRRGLWKVIVVHHSANSVDTPESMDNYHRNVKHWSRGLGYHFVIGNGVKTSDGQIYVGPRWKSQCEGAHCKSDSGKYFGVWRPRNYFNEHGIGICLIGNFEKSSPTRKQIASLQRLISFLCAQTGISPYTVYGHGEVTHRTACPGKNLQRELAQVRAAVARSSALNWPPDPLERFFSGLNDDNPLGAQPETDGFRFARYAPTERVQIAYDGLFDAFDNVADFDSYAFRLTAW